MADVDDSGSRVGFVSHAIDEKDLKPGDHIYCHRIGYSHHGIYIGEPDCEVIHFSGDDEEKLIIGQRNNDKMEQLATLKEKHRKLQDDSAEAKEVQQQIDEILESNHHIRSTTLDKFRNGDEVRLVAYNADIVKKAFTLFRAACHIVKAMPPLETVKLGKYFCDHPEEWRSYHLIDNNCETFACFCKTGRLDIAVQLNQLHRNLISELHVNQETPCETFEEALRKFKMN